MSVMLKMLPSTIVTRKFWFTSVLPYGKMLQTLAIEKLFKYFFTIQILNSFRLVHISVFVSWVSIGVVCCIIRIKPVSKIKLNTCVKEKILSILNVMIVLFILCFTWSLFNLFAQNIFRRIFHSRAELDFFGNPGKNSHPFFNFLA